MTGQRRSVEGRHVIVTGGGTGVGAAIARTYAEQGAKLTITGRRLEPLEEVASETGALAISCDVTDEQAMQAAIAEATARNGPVSIAIANAGAAPSQPFHKLDQAGFEEVLAVNLTGTFNLWNASLAGMKDQGWGRMIAIASIAGLKGGAYISAYCAAKHGVIGLTRSLAVELAKTGITVNAICPGFVETPMLERSIENIVKKAGISPDEAANHLMAGNPQQCFIQAEEVAGTALWLASDTAASINGHALSISGGEI